MADIDPKDIERAREMVTAIISPDSIMNYIPEAVAIAMVASALSAARAEGDAAGYARGRAEGRADALNAARMIADTFGAHEAAEAIALLASTPAGTGGPHDQG